MIQPKIATARLLLRSWSPADAPRLKVVLEQNLNHLRHWIPEDVYTPVPVAALEKRLRFYASSFAAQRAWRFAMFVAESGELIGEASLFPRSISGRGPLEDADRVEIGYWLRADATGHGFATEATLALIAAGMRLPGVAFAEIRCDSRNESSVAIPRKLGFSLAPEETSPLTPTDMVWRLPLAPCRIPGASFDEWVNATISQESPMRITVEAIANAPLTRVWDAWSNPADIKQWNAPAEDWHTTQSTVDLREGGTFLSRMEARDGSAGFDFEGTYTRVVPQRTIEYRMSDDREVAVEFEERSEGTLIRNTFDAETENSPEIQRQGWQAILDNFARYVEARS